VLADSSHAHCLSDHHEGALQMSAGVAAVDAGTARPE
jgi:hypothetical protein